MTGARINSDMRLGIMRNQMFDEMCIHQHPEHGQLIRCGEIATAPEAFWMSKDGGIFFGTNLKIAKSFLPILEEQALYFDCAPRLPFASRLWVNAQYLKDISQFLVQTTARHRIYDQYNFHYFGKSETITVVYGYGTGEYLVTEFSEKLASNNIDKILAITKGKKGHIMRLRFDRAFGWKWAKFRFFYLSRVPLETEHEQS